MADDSRLLYVAEFVPRLDAVADLCRRMIRPLFFPIQVMNGNSPGNPIAVFLVNLFQRALNAVEYTLDQSGRQLHGKRFSGAFHRFSGAQSAGLLIDLHGRPVSSQFDDLSDQLFLADPNDVEHLAVRHIFRHDQRSGNFYDLSLHFQSPNLCLKYPRPARVPFLCGYSSPRSRCSPRPTERV